jgi:hypothetical protein
MPRALIVAFALVFAGLGGLTAAGVGAEHRDGEREGQSEQQREAAEREAGGEGSLVAFAKENPTAMRSKLPLAIVHEKLDHGGEASREATSGPAQQMVDARAYPRNYVSDVDAKAGRSSFLAKPMRLPRTALRPGVTASEQKLALAASWQELGPVTPEVPAEVTYTGAPTQNSGRTTALLVSPTCGQAGRGCRLWVGAAGGGVWRTDDATAAKPVWAPVNTGLQSLAIGSLVADPNDATGQTLYAGTGEPNASSDSEAGLGVFKSTDGGDHWTSLPGSGRGVATDRAVSSIVVDPGDAQHLWIGTAVARHGSSSSNGGRRTPPDAPALGVYETTDGGATFTPTSFITQGDNDLHPQAAEDGTDLFNGGVTKMQLDPNDPSQLYVSAFGYGVYRFDTTDPTASPEQVFATAYPFGSVEPAPHLADTAGDRTEFALVKIAGGKTRMYAGDSSEDNAYGVLWRNEDIAQPAATLVDGGGATSNPSNKASWVDLSNPNEGTTTLNQGYLSYGFCEQQCTYDMFVTADPTDPNTVYLGGSMNYDELFGSADVQAGRTNGRAVLRSTDAGDHFTDMTNDKAAPPNGMHPDQHAIAINPSKPGQFFVASDGGMIRSDGDYFDDSAKCAGRTDQHVPPRPLTPINLQLCQQALKSVPNKLESISDGLATLQFQGVAANPTNPTGDVIGGTQDNGTWGFTGSPTWTESIGGDGGNAAFAADASYRVHTYYGPTQDINYNGNDVNSWLYISQPLDEANEQFSFYVPEVTDPKAPATIFTAGEHVWRTQDAGGDRATLEAHCRETAFAIGDGTTTCGDFVPLGGAKAGRLGPDGNYVVALGRAPSDTGTLWAGRRRGGLFISSNADAAKPDDVAFKNITENSPDRFVSGISVDPTDPNHAWVSYSGYSQYTSPSLDQGHVFEVRYDPSTKKATWTDRSYDIGKAPITDVARDDATGDLYAGTDFGVLRLASGATSWTEAAAGLPLVAVYGLDMSTSGRVLYAATHGRGVYRVALGAAPAAGGGDTPGEPPASGPASTTSTTTPTTSTPGTTKPPARPKIGLSALSVRVKHLARGRRAVTVRFRASTAGKVTVRLASRNATIASLKVTVKRASVQVVTFKLNRRRTTRKTRWTAGLVGIAPGGTTIKKVSFRP